MSLSDKVIVMRDGMIAQEGNPGDIYRHPASAFVAEFVGASNLIPGTIAAALSDGWRVQLEDGIEILCSRDGRQRHAGDNVVLSVRPEDFHVHTGVSGPQRNRWPTQVIDTAFLGNIVNCRMQWGRRVVHVQTDPHAGFADEEAPVFLTVREDRVRVLDRD